MCMIKIIEQMFNFQWHIWMIQQILIVKKQIYEMQIYGNNKNLFLFSSRIDQ